MDLLKVDLRGLVSKFDDASSKKLKHIVAAGLIHALLFTYISTVTYLV